MALTVSNRETFTVLDWLESDPVRKAWWREQAERVAKLDRATAIPRLSDLIYQELHKELPDNGGVSGELLKSGLLRVHFFELAMALLLDIGVSAEPQAA
jgi:hypothetical protein